MQYRLSTLFLIFFVVATTLSSFGSAGLWLSPLILLLAFGINKIKKREFTLVELLVILSITGILVGLLQPQSHTSRETERVKHCADNLKAIGKALHRYHSAHGHFPMATSKDGEGKAIYSWQVDILPELGHCSLYDQLKKDEPWDSSHNFGLLFQQSPKNKDELVFEYSCPSDPEKDPSNYVGIIGPGTAWSEDRTRQLSELPDGGKHTVLILEIVNKGKHWGEPVTITVEKLLEQLKTTKGVVFFSYHWLGSHVLFADGSVWLVPKEMPIPLWQRLLGGDIKNIDDLNGELKKYNSGLASVDFDAAKKPRFFAFENQPAGLNLYAIPVWLFAVILLFRRAIKSRKPAEIAKRDVIPLPAG